MNTLIVPSVSYEHEFEKKIAILSKMNVTMVRINFGRGSIERNLESVYFIHKNYPDMRIAVDLPGNKKRVFSLIEPEIRIKNQEKFNIFISGQSEDIQPSNCINISLDDWDYDISEDDTIMFGDGDLIAKVVSMDTQLISLLALNDGKIKSKSGLLIKEKYKANSTVTDIERYIASETSGCVNEIFLSFADTVERINLCRAMYSNQRIIAKIETPYALNAIDALSAVSDGLLLARGDLQNYFELNEINNDILNMLYIKAQQYNKPVYVATNYFRSIIKNMPLSENERMVLHRTLSFLPKYILLNETCYSDEWLKVCRVAQTEIKTFQKKYKES